MFHFMHKSCNMAEGGESRWDDLLTTVAMFQSNLYIACWTSFTHPQTVHGPRSIKRASSWLTSLPIEEFGFALRKGAFHDDALALRYNYQPLQSPSTCGCGAKYSVEHVLSCPKGGFPSIRSNEIRDLTANLLTEFCSSVCIEPELQPVTGEVLTGATSNAQDAWCTSQHCC